MEYSYYLCRNYDQFERIGVGRYRHAYLINEDVVLMRIVGHEARLLDIADPSLGIATFYMYKILHGFLPQNFPRPVWGGWSGLLVENHDTREIQQAHERPWEISLLDDASLIDQRELCAELLIGLGMIGTGDEDLTREISLPANHAIVNGRFVLLDPGSALLLSKGGGAYPKLRPSILGESFFRILSNRSVIEAEDMVRWYERYAYHADLIAENYNLDFSTG